jgi:hypothetical protein
MRTRLVLCMTGVLELDLIDSFASGKKTPDERAAVNEKDSGAKRASRESMITLLPVWAYAHIIIMLRAQVKVFPAIRLMP